MHFSTLFFACSLSLSVNAVRLAGSEISDVEPCAKALSSNLDCHERIAEFTPGNHGLYWDNEACTKACQQSIRDFHTAVYENCPTKIAFQYGGFMSRGWNLTCDRDPKTGKLCDVSSYDIDPPDKELPRKYLCWPCYARNILLSDIYETTLPLETYKDTWEHQRKRILKECPEDIRDPTPFPNEEASELNTSRDVSMYPRTTESADPTTVYTQSTASATTTASSETNAAETFRQGHLYLTFIFGLAVFYL